VLLVVQQFERLDFETGFFEAFATRAVGRRFSGTTLAAGKLGIARQRSFGPARADEVFPFVLNDGDADACAGQR
jgi:hypothetical protein